MAIQLRPRRDTSSPRLLDQHGAPVPQRIRPTNVSRTRGGAGFSISGGYLADKERDASLRGRNRFLTYSQILADTTIVASGVRYFLNLAAKTPWKVRPANDSEEAKEKADFIEEMIKDMKTPWHRVIRQGAMHRMYGFATMEWTAEKMDDSRGSIRVSHIENRAQWTIERWDTDFSGRVLGVIQRPIQDQSRQIYLPRNKLVYLSDNSFSDDPRGVGILRHVARPVKQLRSYELLEHQGFETDMRGIPIAKAPLGEIQNAVSSGLLS
ncbi:MAG: phage portal protein family protein, partial [Geminicoccaceae bacterium]